MARHAPLIGTIVALLVASAAAASAEEGLGEEPLPEARPPTPEAADADESEGDRTLVAVLFLATGPVELELADNLTEVLVATVASTGDFTIVGREQFGGLVPPCNQRHVQVAILVEVAQFSEVVVQILQQVI